MKGIIFDIERNSYVDGPGIRTTVFFKGCNLRCRWCHNPESQNMKPQILFYKDKCRGCGRCENLSAEDYGFICLNDAKEICGRYYSAEEVMAEVRKDKSFYLSSGGGVTFSGGECLLQTEFLTELLKSCKKEGISTAVDTAGAVEWEKFEKVLPQAELFLYDIKAAEDKIHKEFTGVSNKLILDNYKKLIKSGAKVWVRIPLITGVNDSEEEIGRIAELLRLYPPEKTEILPYHKMGEHKYSALGMPIEKFEVPSNEKIEHFKRLLNEK